MQQLTRYVFVGLVSNLSGYLAYLLLTWFQVGPKLSMSMVYITGATIGYIGNKQWTFSHKKNVTSTLFKYISAHTLGYGLNFIILYIFVDKINYPHQLIQAVAIIFVASFLYIAMKNWVFLAEVDPKNKTAA